MYPYPSYFGVNPYQKMEVVRVSGKGGVDAFQMPPNSSVLLLDETAPLVWLKTTDGAGYPSATPYSIAPYEPKPLPDLGTLEERLIRLEKILNDKSDTLNADNNSGKPEDGTD